jgi:type III secretion protein SpaR/YscT/HrcT
MSDDYVQLYLHSAFAHGEFLPFLSLMFLFMGRMLPIIVLVPFFGGKVLPRPVKVTFVLSLFVIFLPQLMLETKTPITFNIQLALYLAKEVFVGLLIGFFLNIPFMVVQSSGILIDHQRGGSSLMVNDPTMQNQSSPLGTIFNYVLIYLFFMIEGPFLVLDIISQSYTILPPDKMFNLDIIYNSSKLYGDVIKILGKVVILSTQLAAPALIMILMTDFFLGIANRLAPQVQITFLGMPLKSLLALTIVFFGWTLFTEEIVVQAYKALNYVTYLIPQFQPAEG